MKLIKIGRAEGCNLRLHSPNVSSLHAEMLVMDDDTLILEDKNSTNGTYVNNHRVEPGKEVQVRRGDLVRFGDTDLNWAAIPHPERYADVKRLVNIGSNYRNELTVEDPFVSRFHAVLKIKNNNKAFIRDLGSRNGTTVNGVKITAMQDTPIKKGDIVTLGNKDVTDQVAMYLPKKSVLPAVLGVTAGVVALVAAIVVGAFFIFGGPTGCMETDVTTQTARQAVVYVTAEYTLKAKLDDNPIGDDIWMSVIGEMYPSVSGIQPGELPVDQTQYSATAFFLDREGRLATNRHVAEPWNPEYLPANLANEVRSAVDRFVNDQQLPDAVSSVDEIEMYNYIIGNDPRYALWRMVYAEVLRHYKAGERDVVGYTNSLIRQLKHSKVSITGNINEINVGYAGRMYTHMDEFDRCNVLCASPTDDIDLAIIQLNSKKTPADIEFVFSPDNFYLGELEPQKDKLFWIGYPRGANWALDNKTKSLEPTIRETMVAKVPSKYNFEFQGEGLGGASGSPIYMPKGGKLVGVLWGGNTGGATYGQAVQAKYLKKMYDEEVGIIK